MDSTRDDRVLGFTQIVASTVIVVLLLAFVALYILPDQTDWDFAWTIAPRTSAMFIGAGYMAGAYFFFRLIVDKKWHRFQAGFLPITAFTIFMLAATLLHWGRFHQSGLPFYAWTIIYILTPLLVPFVWWRNRKTALIGLESRDLRYPAAVRWTLGLAGAAGALFFLFVFIFPAIFIPVAPWKVTELTTRIFAGWGILSTCTVASLAFDGRWSAARGLVESAMLGLVLVLLALPRMWADFDPAKPLTTLLIVSIALGLLVLIGLHVWLDRLCRAGTRQVSPAAS